MGTYDGVSEIQVDSFVSAVQAIVAEERSSEAGRIADALERIATAVEAQAAADPLAMLNAAMQEDGDMPRLPEPQGPVTSNGNIVIYRHPIDERFEIVARRDETAEGGYSVAVERD